MDSRLPQSSWCGGQLGSRAVLPPPPGITVARRHGGTDSKREGLLLGSCLVGARSQFPGTSIHGYTVVATLLRSILNAHLQALRFRSTPCGVPAVGYLRIERSLSSPRDWRVAISLVSGKKRKPRRFSVYSHRSFPSTIPYVPLRGGGGNRSHCNIPAKNVRYLSVVPIRHRGLGSPADQTGTPISRDTRTRMSLGRDVTSIPRCRPLPLRYPS